MSDVTKRGELFGMDSTTLVGGWYNTLSTTGYTFQPGRRGQRPTWLVAKYPISVDNKLRPAGPRGTQAHSVADRGCRNRLGDDGLERRQHCLQVSGREQSGRCHDTYDSGAAVSEHGTGIRTGLQAGYDEWQYRARVATGYGTPQVSNLFVLSNGQSGNNTSLQTQTNLGYDLGVDWTPNKAVTVSATGFYEFFNNELVTQATP